MLAPSLEQAPEPEVIAAFAATKQESQRLARGKRPPRSRSAKARRAVEHLRTETLLGWNRAGISHPAGYQTCGSAQKKAWAEQRKRKWCASLKLKWEFAT
jgi:hypothetical protein